MFLSQYSNKIYYENNRLEFNLTSQSYYVINATTTSRILDLRLHKRNMG